MAVDFPDILDGTMEELGDELNNRFTALKNGVNLALQNRGAYSGATTYDLNDVINSGGIKYVSLQNANTGHTPASSPLWWEIFGVDGAAITNEAATRAAADTALQTAVNTKANASSLGAETTARQAADTALQDGLDNKVNIQTYGAKVSELEDAIDAKASSDDARFLRIGNRISFLGDSLTESVHGYAQLAAAASGGTIWMPQNHGIGGQTSTQIIARLPDVIAEKPSACAICMGTNNLNFATVTADYETAITTLQGAGIVPILVSLRPDNNLDGNARAIKLQINDWMRLRAMKSGLIYVDLYSPTVDRSTGNFGAGLNAPDDATHTGTAGQQLEAAAFLEAVLPFVPRNRIPLCAHHGAPSLINNSFYLDGTYMVGASELPNGFFLNGGESAGIVNSVVTRDGFEWVRVEMTNAEPRYGFFQHNINLSGGEGVPGERWAFCGRVRTQGIEAGALMVQFNVLETGARFNSSFMLYNDVENGFFYTEFVWPAAPDPTLIVLQMLLLPHYPPDVSLSGVIETANWTLCKISL